MKKLLIVLILLQCIVYSHAQKDSTKRKSRIFSVQAELGVPPWLNAPDVSQNDYRRSVTNHEMLNADYSSYDSYSSFWFQEKRFQGMPAIKIYADLDGKRYKKEIYFGLSYSLEYVSGLTFYKEFQDTAGVFSDPVNNKILFNVLSTHDSYNFSILANRWMIPIGFNFTTNPQKFFWISMGLQVAPAISTNYKFVTNHSEVTTEYLLEPGEEIKYGNGYRKTEFMNGRSNARLSSSLHGLGFGLYVSAPVCVYLHPFKRAKFFRHLNPMLCANPYFGIAKHKYTPSSYGLGIMMSLGIRYSW